MSWWGTCSEVSQLCFKKEDDEKEKRTLEYHYSSEIENSAFQQTSEEDSSETFVPVQNKVAEKMLEVIIGNNPRRKYTSTKTGRLFGFPDLICNNNNVIRQ